MPAHIKPAVLAKYRGLIFLGILVIGVILPVIFWPQKWVCANDPSIAAVDPKLQGWLPEFLPASANNICAKYWLDSNELIMKFSAVNWSNYEAFGFSAVEVKDVAGWAENNLNGFLPTSSEVRLNLYSRCIDGRNELLGFEAGKFDFVYAAPATNGAGKRTCL